jgi:hypothetical protein
MNRYLIILIVIFFAGISDGWAQKYPERRVVRAGNNHFKKGNYTEAEVDYKRANSIAPTFEGKFNHAGSVYKQERWDDALKEYNALLDDSTNTHRPEVFYNQGNTLFKKNSLKESIEAYKSALRLNPNDQEAKFNLAYAQKKLRDQQQQQQNQQQNQDQNQQNQQNQNQDQQQQDNKNNQNNQDNKDQNKDNQDKNQQDPENNKNDDNKDNNQNQNQDQNQNDPNKDNGKNDNQNRDNNQGSGNQPQGKKMPQEVAEQMLKAMEANEDKTREKVEGEKQKGYVVGGGVKNW